MDLHYTQRGGKFVWCLIQSEKNLRFGDGGGLLMFGSSQCLNNELVYHFSNKCQAFQSILLNLEAPVPHTVCPIFWLALARVGRSLHRFIGILSLRLHTFHVF